jgi:very-short-patch-repair endonuclease
LGRVDLYYPERRLAIEYDGSTHKDSLAADNRRQNAILQAGVELLRFTYADVVGNPEQVVAVVTDAYRQRSSAGTPRGSRRQAA